MVILEIDRVGQEEFEMAIAQAHDGNPVIQRINPANMSIAYLQCGSIGNAYER